MRIIDGRSRANEILSNLAKEINKTQAKVKLAVIQVGNDPASSVYVRNKELAAEKVGIETDTRKLPFYVNEEPLI